MRPDRDPRPRRARALRHPARTAQNCRVTMPMFPLGSVLFPGQLLPLHIFEPRYRQMLEHCLAGNREFGVVLIERGHEVGGGDIRSGIGTVATVLESAEAAPGHWAIVAAGTRRVRVLRWHPDDPWPHADVEDLVDTDVTDDADDTDAPGDPGATADPGDSAAAVDVESRWQALQQRLPTIAALAAELGDDSMSTLPAVAADPALGSFQIAALSPLGDFDRQRVLATTSVTQRLTLLTGMLDDVAGTLRAAIALGGDDSPPDP